MKNKNTKKGFTLLEIIIAIIVGSFISTAAFKEYTHNQWLGSVNDLNASIVNIVNNGVMNSETGYINQSGGDCSNDLTYKDISAARVIDCKDWSTTYPYEGIKSTNGTESYISTLLKEYTTDSKGCKFYIDELNSNSFYYFVDCSNVNYKGGDSSTKKYLEQKMVSSAKTTLSTMFLGADRLASSITNDSGGDADDGKVRILVKK